GHAWARDSWSAPGTGRHPGGVREHVCAHGREPAEGPGADQRLLPGTLPGLLDGHGRAAAALRPLPRLRIPGLLLLPPLAALVPVLDARASRPAAPGGLREPVPAAGAVRHGRVGAQVRPAALGTWPWFSQISAGEQSPPTGTQL